MEVRLQGKKEAPLKGIDPVLAEINKRLQSHPHEWSADAGNQGR